MYTPGTVFDGRYLLKEQKGRGSFGEVWLATDQQVGVDFAIKIYVAMSTQGLEEFRKEYQLSCNLINSNLLHANYMGICQENSCPYLVMPFCPRGTSSMVGNVDEKTLWKFLHDVANGLAYLHNQTPPIVHQDIKPDNILQTQSGDFVITDFGISKQMRATLHSTANNSSGAIAYMGPERFSGDYQTIKASDIWSLGATLYELATGRLPFEGRGGSFLNAGADLPNLPEQFSSEINHVMRSCMAKEPWERPSASQLVEISDNILKRHPLSKETSPSAPSFPESSHSLIYIICGGVAVLLLGFIGYMLWGSEGDNPSYQPESQPTIVEEQAPVKAAEQNTPASSVEPRPMETERSASAAVSPQQEPKEGSKSPQKVNDLTSGTVNLGYATWTGSIRNGKPQGLGTMSFTRDYDLQGHAIKAGDVIKGQCENGKLTGYCKWHGEAGDKSILLGE